MKPMKHLGTFKLKPIWTVQRLKCFFDKTKPPAWATCDEYESPSEAEAAARRLLWMAPLRIVKVEPTVRRTLVKNFKTESKKTL